MKKILTYFLFLGLITSCANDADPIDLEKYLNQNSDYVHSINGFYIVGSKAKPNSDNTTPGTTGEDIFDHSVRLFSNFLDQNNDGIIDEDKKELNRKMAKTVLFVTGPLSMIDKISLSKEVKSKNIYVMAMETDNWPYVKDYNGKGWSFDKLSSSMWRPPTEFNALWEETFHTVTEALSRTDDSFAFTKGKKLRTYMDDDIKNGTYETEVQNNVENGAYDKVTAVNEYIHQIWAINFAGHSDKLNVYQKKALDFMISKEVPMNLHENYNHTIGTVLKK